MRLLKDAGVLSAAVAAGVAGLWACAMPSSNGALYVALAGGRDVLHGNLGRPDTWAFTTGGAVWVHPSWGSDALLALVFGALGGAGVLLLRALLLAGAAAKVVVASRDRGAGTRAGLLAAAIALAACGVDAGTWSGLWGLLLAPGLLAVLTRSERRPRWIWLAPAVVWLWANLDGTFVVGIAVLALWTVSQLAAWAFRRTEAARVGRTGLATLAAVALGGFANPFGFRSLLLPFTIWRSSVWREAAGWTPWLGKHVVLSDVPWAFVALAVLVAVPLVVRSVVYGVRREFSAARLFDVLLAGSALAAAFGARAFMPLAAFLLAPILAESLQWMLRPERRTWPAWMVAGAVVAAVVAPSLWVARYYDAGNPRYPRESMLERMAGERTRFPFGAAAFLAANGVRGRVFHDARWEGYLRWTAPELSLFLGGRGGEVYSDSLDAVRNDIMTGATPAPDLRALGVPLAVIPLNVDYAGFTKWLLLDPGATWAYVYCDRYCAVLVDVSDPAGRSLVDRAAAGNLVYGDPGVAALSRGMCLACPAVSAPPSDAADVLKTAVQLLPTGFAYQLLIDRARKAGAAHEDVIRYLETQLQALEIRDANSAEGLQILKSREDVARLLLRLYDAKTQPTERAAMLESLTRSGKGIRALRSD